MSTDNRTCHCGHDETDHNYTPSGCGSTHCMVDNEYGGYAPTCSCREYWPASEDEEVAS